MDDIFNNMESGLPDGRDPQKNMIFTGFECNRCGSMNAIRMNVAVQVNNITGERVYKYYDYCSRCLLDMNSLLLSRVPTELRELWLNNFQEGIIK